MKVYYNESCSICRAEINLYKKQNIKEINWIDITNNDDGIRDAAIATLKALLHSNLEIFPTQQSQTTTTTNGLMLV